MTTLSIEQVHDVGKRLDHYLVSNLNDHSRSKIQSWIRSGYILVNNQNVKTGYSLELNDQIQISPPKIDESLKNIKPEEIKLDILYEDNDLVVINKPAGLVVHPGHGNYSGTLVTVSYTHLTLPTNREV